MHLFPLPLAILATFKEVIPPLLDLVNLKQLYFELIDDDTAYTIESVGSVDKEGNIRAMLK